MSSVSAQTFLGMVAAAEVVYCDFTSSQRLHEKFGLAASAEASPTHDIFIISEN